MNSWERRDCHNFSCVGLTQVGGGREGEEQQNKYKILAQRDPCQKDPAPLQKPGLSGPELRTQLKGRAPGLAGFPSCFGSGMTVGGEKDSDFLRNSSLVPKGPLSPLRDFPGFSKSRRDTPPFRKKWTAGTSAQPWTGALGSRRLRPGRGALGTAADVPS